MKTVFFSLLMAAALTGPAWASPERADALKLGCLVCHIQAEGGALNETGMAFVHSGYVWPPPKDARRAAWMLSRPARSATGYLHLLASFMWFGTILYVHIVLRPAYAAKGLPKVEALLGISAITLTGATGLVLTLSRINSSNVLHGTAWGKLLFLKIILYSVMALSATFVVLYLGPRLRKTKRTPQPPVDGIFDPATLAFFDGKEGRPAYFAFNRKVYNATGLGKWAGGMHFKHRAGEDLTAELAKAPHGPEKPEGLTVIGSFDSSKLPEKTTAQKIFIFLAYMNLCLVFVILLVVAVWRWAS